MRLPVFNPFLNLTSDWACVQGDQPLIGLRTPHPHSSIDGQCKVLTRRRLLLVSKVEHLCIFLCDVYVMSWARTVSSCQSVCGGLHFTWSTHLKQVTTSYRNSNWIKDLSQQTIGLLYIKKWHVQSCTHNQLGVSALTFSVSKIFPVGKLWQNILNNQPTCSHCLVLSPDPKVSLARLCKSFTVINMDAHFRQLKKRIRWKRYSHGLP